MNHRFSSESESTMRFSWNAAAAAAALTALILLFPISSSRQCDANQGTSSECTTTQESLLVRYTVGFAAAIGISVGAAAVLGTVVYTIGNRAGEASTARR